MDSQLGTSPSYTWRGIWESKWVLRRGICWRVGNGANIGVWDDSWIPGTQSRRLLSPRGINDAQMKVNELINSETYGVYSFRSAYRALINDEWLKEEEAPSMVNNFWGKILSLHVLPRVKIFAWRACQNAIPTLRGINSRIQTFDATCCICGRENETTIHALRECNLAREIWLCSTFSKVLEGSFASLIDWWEWCIKEFEEHEVEEIITLSWAIWNARNKAVLLGEKLEPSSVLSYARKVCEELRGVEMKKGGGRADGRTDAAGWKPPDTGLAKVNVDAGLLGEVGSGIGVVCIDDRGEITCCAAVQFAEIWDTKIAEAKAVFWGMKVALETGLSDIVIESDCLQVVDALRNKIQGTSHFHLILDDIVALAFNFSSVVWSFVKHGGNKVAHELAHYQPWDVGKRVWRNVIPPRISAVAANDILV
ncbi:uncharacterized protein LOC110730762 [Chenopodium quinoa]|uniref:uncharacterized protein LOC110730762 n=1 Tax=Chenopodium quinoa TaxID=63459 RepID=UPI000B78F572|nr:uncharacterized protein LOC110730762 [Chenopodium quinoa]